MQESGSWFNPIRPGLRQISARQFKITTILKWFNALVPCFMTFSFQVLFKISEKNGPGCAWLVWLRSYSSRAHPATQNPRYWFCGYNRLNANHFVHELLCRHQ